MLPGSREGRNFAAMGALATILMLGFQPFVQQTVNVNGVRWMRLPVEPRIGYATIFSELNLDTCSVFGRFPFSVDHLMQENAQSS